MNFKVARAELHNWEEPVISGDKGSGTVFFSGCTMKCEFCQNYEISHGNKGLIVTEDELLNLFFKLEDEGAHNINLVTPSPFAKKLPFVLEKFKARSSLPIVYNTSSYEPVDIIKNLDGLVDIYLPDLKYFSDAYAVEFSHSPRYFEVASQAILEMRRQRPKEIFQDNLLKEGVIVRHLVLPSLSEDSKKVLDFLSTIPQKPLISLMAQYFPTPRVNSHPVLGRRITIDEYESVLDYADELGFDGFMQDAESATEDYVPSFDLSLLKQKLQ